MENETIDSLRKFLEFGAIGIAGLMLVLVVVTLVTTTVTSSKERLLKRFMYIGAFCFLVATISQVFIETRPFPGPVTHTVTLEVVPHDSGTIDIFPPPIIRMGGVTVDRAQPMIINADSTLIVDLLDGVDLFKAKEQQVNEAAQKIEEASNMIIQQSRALVEAQAQTQAVSAEINQLKAVASSFPGVSPRIDSISRDLLIIDRGITRGLTIIP